MSDERKALNRRQFLRRAAVTTAAAAWATPVVQSIAARPAYGTTGTPVPCDWSACVGACAESGNSADCGGPPGQVCQGECTTLCGGRAHETPCPEATCVPGNWVDCVFD